MVAEVSGPRLIRKNLEYAVIATFIDYDPKKYGPVTVDVDKLYPRVIFVDGKIAIKLKGRLYTKV